MGDETPGSENRRLRAALGDRARRLATCPSAQIAMTLLIGIAGGTIANFLRVPLAWILGPLVACTAGALMGLPLRPVPYGREAAHPVIGLAIGLRFTPPVLAATAGLLPAMLVGTLYVIAVTTIAAFVLRPLAQVDRKTAFFGSAAAGMAEMAIIAHRVGGDPQAVSVVHAIRVTVIVLIVPLLVFAFGTDEGIQEPVTAEQGGALELVVLLALAVSSSVLLSRTRLPNPWFLGPIFLGAVAASTWTTATIPWPLLVAAQIVLGISLGSRFDRNLIRRLPRVAAAALLISGFLILASLLGAAGLSAATGLSFATSFLAIAPAGVTEMVLTASIMHLDTAAVTAFHVMRIAFIHMTVLMTYKLYERLSLRLEKRKT